jgi:esterase
VRLPLFGEDTYHYIEVNGVRLRYLDTEGSGRAILLLHGLNQYSRAYELVLPALDGLGRIIIPDHRGHGGSDLPGVTYTPGCLVEDYRQFIQKLGLQKPVVIGHSLGGWIGFQLAGRYPDLLGALVAADIAPGRERPPTAEERAQRQATLAPGVGDATWADEAEARAALKLARPEETDDMLTARIRQQLRVRPDGRLERARSFEIARAMLEDVMASNLWPLLPAIKVPTLIIRADGPDGLKPEVAERMIRAIPDAQLAVVRHSYHNLQLHNPTDFGDAIAAFIRQL